MIILKAFVLVVKSNGEQALPSMKSWWWSLLSVLEMRCCCSLIQVYCAHDIWLGADEGYLVSYKTLDSIYTDKCFWNKHFVYISKDWNVFRQVACNQPAY